LQSAKQDYSTDTFVKYNVKTEVIGIEGALSNPFAPIYNNRLGSVSSPY
jgi:hypothetical protein